MNYLMFNILEIVFTTLRLFMSFTTKVHQKWRIWPSTVKKAKNYKDSLYHYSLLFGKLLRRVEITVID